MRLKSFLWVLFIIFRYTVTFSQVTADFIFDKSEGCGSLAVNFKDQSTVTSGTIVDWKWDLGGNISSKQNPGIIFTKAGEYTICLTVKLSNGATNIKCKQKIIKVYENPKPDFDVDVKNGCQPVDVKFKDLSTSDNGKIKNWIWDIGGSANVITTSDPKQVIQTTYTTAGNYTSTLSITDDKGCNAIVTKQNLIKVESLPSVSIDYKFLSSCDLPWNVQFSNLEIDPLAIYVWDLGNGQSFMGATPPITVYTESKSYNISLQVQKGSCKDTFFYDKLINTNRITDFHIINQSLCQNQIIKLRDTSNYVADSLIWDFGDGTTTGVTHPEHIYKNAGCFTISLIKYIGGCVQKITKPCIQIQPKAAVTYDIDNGYACLIPSKVTLKANTTDVGTFEWKIKNGSGDTSLLGAQQNLDINKFGKYTFQLLFKGQNGCVDLFVDSFAISKFESQLPSLGPKACAPFEAMLSDSVISSVPIQSWKWEIGNPVVFTSADANPIFSVQDTGRWDVRLVVENIYGCKDTIFKKDYIQGGKKVKIDFVANPLDDCLKVEREFKNLSESFATNFFWTYNAGTFFSFSKDPKYVFNEYGVYDITLTAFHNGCPSTLTKEKYINVWKPSSKFDVKYRCDDPYTIDIQNLSLGADSLYWVVELSSTATDTIRDSLLQTYTFPDRGLYFLTHYTKSFETGCEHISRDSIFIVDLAASYILDTVRGCAPLQVKVSSTVQDAVSSTFLPGQYTITNPVDQDVTVTFTEGGSIQGPQLEVIDRHGCRDTFQTSTPVEVSKIKAKIESADVFCIPSDEQLIDSSKMGLGFLTSRQWQFSYNNQTSGLPNPIFNIQDPGNYTAKLVLKDSWGCSDSVTKEIKAVTLIPSFTSDTLSCISKGVRFKVTSDPTFLNAFEWNFGDDSTSVEKNPLHFYKKEDTYDICVELFDSRGCSKKICNPKQIKIQNPKAGFSGNPLSAPCPPLLSNLLNESKNANTFTWDFGDNSGLSYNSSPSHVYTSPGNFTVTLFAQMIPGCVDTLVKTEFINLLGPKAAMSYSLFGNCIPLQVQLKGEADKSYEFIWDYGDGKINVVPGLISSNSASYSYTKPGRYTPKLLVSDVNGCSRTFIGDPIIVNNIDPSFDPLTKPICGLPNTVTILNKTIASTPDLSYAWNLQGGISLESTDQNPTFLIDTYGIYDLTLIATATNCIDTFHLDNVLEIAPIPIVDFNLGNNVFCQYNEISLSNKSTIEEGKIDIWKWEINDIQYSKETQPMLKIETTGNQKISLLAISDKGCKDSIAKSINILPNTLIQLGENKTICIGDSINLVSKIESSSPFNILWQNVGNLCDTCRNINVKPIATTTYYLSSSATSGCTSSDSIIVKVIPIQGPKLSLSSDTTVCKDGNINIKINNFNPNYKYEWDTNDIGLDCYDNCQSPSASPKDDTFFSVIVSNSFGCLKEDSILVKVEKSIEDFLKLDKSICEGQGTILEIQKGNNPIWSSKENLSCESCPKPSISPSKSALYFVTVTSDAGCKYNDSILVNVIPKSAINAGEDLLICKGEKVKLNGKGIGEIKWNSNTPISEQNILNPEVNPQTSDVFTLSMKVDECSLTDKMTITVIEKVKIEVVGDTICPNETAILSASGNAQEYNWYHTKDKLKKGQTLERVADISEDLMVIGNKSICIPDTAFVRLYVHPKIEYDLLQDEYEVFINSKEKVKAIYPENNDYKFLWSPSTGLSCDDCPLPIISYNTSTYLYDVNIIDKNDCRLEKRISTKFVNQCSKKGFYIPNIFTPYNNDSRNDRFKVYAEDEAEFISISIYDRWGDQIFFSDNIDKEWDGIYKGQKLALGVYVYILKAKCSYNNEIINFGGDITIID